MKVTREEMQENVNQEKIWKAKGRKIWVKDLEEPVAKDRDVSSTLNMTKETPVQQESRKV